MFRPIIRKSRIAREDDNQLQGSDGEASVVPPTIDDAMVVDTSFIDDSLQEASIAREEAELEQLEGDIAVAEVSRDRLERVKEGLEKTIENGGMTPVEADMAELATDQALTDIGIDGDEPVIPATEEYLTDPLQATRLAIESLSDKIKHAGNVIWAGIKKMFAFLGTIITHLMKPLERKFSNYGRAFKTAVNSNKEYDINNDLSEYDRKVLSTLSNFDGTAYVLDPKDLLQSFINASSLHSYAVDAFKHLTNYYKPDAKRDEVDSKIFDDEMKKLEKRIPEDSDYEFICDRRITRDGMSVHMELVQHSDAEQTKRNKRKFRDGEKLNSKFFADHVAVYDNIYSVVTKNSDIFNKSFNDFMKSLDKVDENTANRDMVQICRHIRSSVGELVNATTRISIILGENYYDAAQILE